MRSPSQPAGLTSAHSLPARPSAEYLRNMGVDLSKAVTSHPMVLSLCIDRNVMPTVAYLRSMGMTQLGRVLTQQPSILSLSVTANLVSLAQMDRDTRQTSCRSPPPLPCRRRFSLYAARPFDRHPRWPLHNSRWPLHTSHRPPHRSCNHPTTSLFGPTLPRAITLSVPRRSLRSSSFARSGWT